MIVTKNERIPRASKPKKGKRKKRKNRKKNLHDLPSQYSKFAEFHVRVDRGAVTSSNEFVIRLNNSAASRRTFLDESFKNGSSVHSSNFYSSPSLLLQLSQSRLFRLFRIKSDIRSLFTLAVSRECLKRILKRNIMRTRRNRGADLCFIAGPRLDKYGGRHPPSVQP